MNTIQLINSIKESTNRGAKFISFAYKSKGHEETSIFTLLLGVNLKNAYKRDLKLISHIKTMSAVEEMARKEIVESLKDSLRLGNNPRFTQKDLYYSITRGVRLNTETGQLHLWGFIVRKQVIEAGIFRPIKSSEKTIAKNKIRKHMKSARFRDFVLSPENIAGMRINGGVIEFQI